MTICLNVRNWILLVVLLLLRQISIAQTISGRVIGEHDQPVEYATVRIHLEHDNSSNQAILANEKGEFILENIKEGNYIITSSSIGWRTDSARVMVPSSEIIILRLREMSHLLHEVLIQGQRPLVEKRVDRLIYNIGNSLVAENSTLWEMLSKAPLVRTDERNGISIRNTPGVSVYVNDRRVYLTGEELAQYLQTIRAGDVARIEVITTPPARYDAEGNSGVLNIVLKSNPNLGLNGSAQTTFIQTRYAKFTPSLNLNFRNKLLNLYGNNSFSDGNYYRIENYEQKYIATNYNESLQSLYHLQSNGSRIGVDIFVSPKHTIGFLFQSAWRSSHGKNTNNSYFSNKENIDSTIVNNATERQLSRNNSINVNYQFAIDTTGKALTIDVDLVRFDAPLNYAVNNNKTHAFLAGSNRFIEFSNGVDRSIKILAAKVDYVHPIVGAGVWELGAKAVDSKAENTFLFENIKNADQLSANVINSSFAYTERVVAAYNSYKQTIGKWDLQLGLRGEWTSASGTSQNDKLFEIKYLKIFPTAYIQYNKSSNAQYNINYSRRVQRPDFASINPFRNYVTPYSYYVGNPFLQPSFTHALEASLLYMSKYNFSLFYRITSGRQTQIPIQNQETNSYTMTYVNIEHSGTYGIDASVSQSILPFWEINATVSGMVNYSKSTLLSNEFKLNGFLFTVVTANSFVLSKNNTFKGEIIFNYLSPGNIQGAFRLGHQASLDIGLSKQLLSKRALLSITGTDLFDNAYVSARVAFRDQQSLTTGSLDRRGVRISLRYSFGNTSVKASRDRDTGTASEKSRL